MAENSNIFAKFLLTCLGVFVLLLYGVIFILISPLLVWRVIVQKLSVVLRPDLLRIIPATSSLFARCKTLQPNQNVIFCLKLSGKLEFESTKARISNVLLERDKNEQFIYPEFQMKAVNWLGYWFWKCENDFKFDDHVRCVTVQSEMEEETFVSSFENDFLKEPFEEDQSPWELAFVGGSDSNSPSWYLFFKFHHILADGFSVFNCFIKSTDNYSPVPISRDCVSNSEAAWRKVFKIVWNVATLLPLQLAQMIIGSILNRIFVIAINSAALDRRILISREIPVSELKKISCDNEVSTLGVVLSCASAGIQQILLASNKHVPKFMSTIMPAPRPGRPDGLTNHFTTFPLNLPVGDANSTERLQTCERAVQSGKKSQYVIIAPGLLKFFGSLPTWLIPNPAYLQGVIISCFPGPKHQVSLNGQLIINMHFNIWWNTDTSLLLCILSYNGRLQVLANADKAVISEDALKEFMTGFDSEVLSLQSKTRRINENRNEISAEVKKGIIQ